MATVTFTDNDSDTGGGSPSNFTALNINAGDGGRTIFIGLFTVSLNVGSTIVTSVTVDGIAATEVIQTDASNGSVSNVAALFKIKASALPDPTVSDVDAEVTWGGGFTALLNVYAAVYVTPDALENATHDTAVFGGTDLVADLSIDTTSGGISIGVSGMNYANSGGADADWVGLTEDLDLGVDTNYHFSTAHASAQSAATPLTVTETESAPGGPSLHAAVSASFSSGVAVSLLSGLVGGRLQQGLVG